MRKGMEVMSLLYLRGAETDRQTDRQRPGSAGVRSNSWEEQKASPFLLLYERVNASLPGGHLKRQVCDGQRQLGGRRRDNTCSERLHERRTGSVCVCVCVQACSPV